MVRVRWFSSRAIMSPFWPRRLRSASAAAGCKTGALETPFPRWVDSLCALGASQVATRFEQALGWLAEGAQNQQLGVGVPNARQLEPDHALAEDNGRAQACGVAGLGSFLLTRRPFGRLANDALGILVFVLTDRCRDSSDVEIVRLADVLSDSV